MVKKIIFLVCCSFLFNSCASIEKVQFKKWNRLSAEKKLEVTTPADFNYKVVSHLKKNKELKFFAAIDSAFVMNLKEEFRKRLDYNQIICRDTITDARFEIEVKDFDFEEKRYQDTSTVDHMGLKREGELPIGLASDLKIHFSASIYDKQTNQKKEIKIDERHGTWVDTSALSKYVTVERGDNINVGIGISNIIIAFANDCSEFIKNAK